MKRPIKKYYLTTNQREYQTELNKYYSDLELYVEYLEELNYIF